MPSYAKLFDFGSYYKSIIFILVCKLHIITTSCQTCNSCGTKHNQHFIYLRQHNENKIKFHLRNCYKTNKYILFYSSSLIVGSMTEESLKTIFRAFVIYFTNIDDIRMLWNNTA